MRYGDPGNGAIARRSKGWRVRDTVGNPADRASFTTAPQGRSGQISETYCGANEAVARHRFLITHVWSTMTVPDCHRGVPMRLDEL